MIASLSEEHARLVAHREPTDAEEALMAAEIEQAKADLRAAHAEAMLPLKGRGYTHRPNVISRARRAGKNIGAD